MHVSINEKLDSQKLVVRICFCIKNICRFWNVRFVQLPFCIRIFYVSVIYLVEFRCVLFLDAWSILHVVCVHTPLFLLANDVCLWPVLLCIVLYFWNFNHFPSVFLCFVWVFPFSIQHLVWFKLRFLETLLCSFGFPFNLLFCFKMSKVFDWTFWKNLRISYFALESPCLSQWRKLFLGWTLLGKRLNVSGIGTDSICFLLPDYENE